MYGVGESDPHIDMLPLRMITIKYVKKKQLPKRKIMFPLSGKLIKDKCEKERCSE